MLQLPERGLAHELLTEQELAKPGYRIPREISLALGTWTIRTVVIRVRMRVKPQHLRVHQCRTLTRPTVFGCRSEGPVTRDGVSSIAHANEKVRKILDQSRDVPSRRLHVDRDADRIAVVLDHEQHRQLAG